VLKFIKNTKISFSFVVRVSKKLYLCDMKDLNEIIKYNINCRLRDKNLIVENFCDAIGITRSAYFARLRGNIGLATLEQIAEFLGCRVVDLLIEPCEQIVPTDCANNEPVISNLIECPNCGMKMYVSAIKDLK
jgi:DNA-binding Xre family transcriptional regulator